MAQKFRNFYEILGVSPAAGTPEIKSAYRRLVKKHHPDVSGGDAGRFQLVMEAYEVLVDPENRERYDRMFRRFYGGSQKRVRAETINRFWEEVRRQREAYRKRTAAENAPGETGQKTSRKTERRAPAPGRDVEQELTIPFPLAVQGGGVEILVPHLKNRLRLEIPAGVDTGTRLSLPGKGLPGKFGGAPGKLVIVLQVESHPRLVRREWDLHLELPINLAQAMLGSRVQVELVSGRKAELRIPPGTQSETRFRLKGQGVHHDGRRGDLVVKVRVVIPPILTPQQKKLIERLATDLGLKY